MSDHNPPEPDYMGELRLKVKELIDATKAVPWHDGTHHDQTHPLVLLRHLPEVLQRIQGHTDDLQRIAQAANKTLENTSMFCYETGLNDPDVDEICRNLTAIGQEWKAAMNNFGAVMRAIRTEAPDLWKANANEERTVIPMLTGLFRSLYARAIVGDRLKPDHAFDELCHATLALDSAEVPRTGSDRMLTVAERISLLTDERDASWAMNLFVKELSDLNDLPVELRAFFGLMAREYRANRTAKGEGWRGMNVLDACADLTVHHGKAAHAMFHEDKAGVREHTADTAVCAFFMAYAAQIFQED